MGNLADLTQSVGISASDININNILSIAIIVFVAWEVLGGLRRGFFRQLIHTALVVCAAVVSYYATEYLLEFVVTGVDQHTFNDYLVGLVGSDNPIAAFVPYITFAEWILILPATTVIAPLLFTGVFFILNMVVRLLYSLIFFIFPKARGIISRLLGALLSVVSGLVIAVMIFFPAYGIVNMAEGAVDVIREKDNGEYTEFVEKYDNIADQIVEHKFFQLINDLGGKEILETFSTITVDGDETNLVHEIDGVVGIIVDLSQMKDADFRALTEDQKKVVFAATDTIESSPYLTNLAVNMFTDLGRAANDSILPINVDPTYQSLIISAVGVFSSTTKENIHTDIDTILEVYFLLCDSGALKAYGVEGGESDMKTSLIAQDENGDTVISRVVDKLNENEHMKPIVTAITEMTIQMLAGQLGMDYDTLNAYGEIKTGLNDVLSMDPNSYGTPEEYKAARDENINSVLTEQGVTLDSETITQIGDYIDDTFEDKDELSDQEINDILLYYFETAKNDGTLPELPPDVEIPEGELPEGEVPEVETPADGE